MYHVPQEAVEQLPHDSLLQIEELTQVHVLPSIEFRRLGDHHPLSGFNVFSYASKFPFIFLAKFVINGAVGNIHLLRRKSPSCNSRSPCTGLACIMYHIATYDYSSSRVFARRSSWIWRHNEGRT